MSAAQSTQRTAALTPVEVRTWRHVIDDNAAAFDVDKIAGTAGDGLAVFDYHFQRQRERLSQEPALRSSLEQLHRGLLRSHLPFHVHQEESIREVRVDGGVPFDNTFVNKELDAMRAEAKARKQLLASGLQRQRATSSAATVVNALRWSGLYLPDFSVQAQGDDWLSALGSVEVKAYRSRRSLDTVMARWETSERLRKADLLVFGPGRVDERPPVDFLDSKMALAELKRVGKQALLRQVTNLELPVGLKLTHHPGSPAPGIATCEWEETMPAAVDRRIRRAAFEWEDARLKARVGVAQEMGYALQLHEMCGAAHGIVVIGVRMARMLVLDERHVVIETAAEERGVVDPVAFFNDIHLHDHLPHVLVDDSGVCKDSLGLYLSHLRAMVEQAGETPLGECPSKLAALRRADCPLDSSRLVTASTSQDVRSILGAARPSLQSASASGPRADGGEPQAGHKRRRDDDDDDQGPRQAPRRMTLRSDAVAARQGVSSGSAAAHPSDGSSSTPSGSRQAAAGPILLPMDDVADAWETGDELRLGEDAITYGQLRADAATDGEEEADADEEADTDWEEQSDTAEHNDSDDDEGAEDKAEKRFRHQLRRAERLITVFERCGVVVETIDPAAMDRLVAWSVSPQARVPEPQPEAVSGRDSLAPSMERTGTTQSATTGPRSPSAQADTSQLAIVGDSDANHGPADLGDTEAEPKNTAPDVAPSSSQLSR